ncbi:hypothetical protein N7481_009531 [Penicillium waksmanii]|uniref:uncharacterized protein n=1 Tax=Penicillium waksmanii TaxID=69791 RepID=UPI0025494FBD|nr:uncharacterized protein N7481_009531 [Penicillium waksmanii]KAJ5975824.1 hypothetical protein N7481_009531 [Penicillium waksmanii]
MDICNMEKRSSSQDTKPPLTLDPISEWRALQALSVYFTVLLNRQIRRRWLLEHESMKNKPISEHFRPIIFLEPVPALHKPLIPNNTNTDPAQPGLVNANFNSKYNPYNKPALESLKTKVHLLRARVEKGKELASEIERRMQDPRIQFPTHFCHTCVMGGDCVDVLLTKCGHRVCRTCLSFGIDKDGIYECSICFAPASFVVKSPLNGRSQRRSCSEQISNASMRIMAPGKLE